MTLRPFILAALVLFVVHSVFAGGGQQLDAARVRLLPGSPFYDRQQLHRTNYLASWNCDKLLFHYRALAGLPEPNGLKGGYAGWDSGFIRGHMAGHYLSAASRMAASLLMISRRLWRNASVQACTSPLLSAI